MIIVKYIVLVKLRNEVNIILMVSVRMFFLFLAATPCYTVAQSGEIRGDVERSFAYLVEYNV